MKPYLSDNELKYFKEIGFQYEKDGFPGADPLLIDIIKRLNRKANIAPMYSCEGHPNNSAPHARAYWMFAANKQGVEELESMFMAFAEKVKDELNIPGFTANLSLSMCSYRGRRDECPVRILEFFVEKTTKQMIHTVLFDLLK